jgi:hypothetical protein
VQLLTGLDNCNKLTLGSHSYFMTITVTVVLRLCSVCNGVTSCCVSRTECSNLSNVDSPINARVEFDCKSFVCFVS